MRRREFIAGLGAAACPVDIYLAVAQAQSYPVRSITLVVPLASGGAVDTVARITAEKLRERLQQPVVVENRPGAGSVIGTAFVAKAPRDGYTLLLMEPGAVLAKWLNKTVPFDVDQRFLADRDGRNFTARSVRAAVVSRKRREGADLL